jgi:hypothetical protein
MLHASLILVENFCQGIAFSGQWAKCDGMVGDATFLLLHKDNSEASHPSLSSSSSIGCSLSTTLSPLCFMSGRKASPYK